MPVRHTHSDGTAVVEQDPLHLRVGEQFAPALLHNRLDMPRDLAAPANGKCHGTFVRVRARNE